MRKKPQRMTDREYRYQQFLLAKAYAQTATSLTGLIRAGAVAKTMLSQKRTF